MTTIEPAIGTELQTIDDVVAYRLGVEAVEHHDRLAVGDEVAVGIGNEKQLRRAGDPDAALTDCDGSETFALVPENGAFVRLAVAIAVFKDDDPVL